MDELNGQHYGCGCIAYISHIKHCRLHAAAQSLLTALEILVRACDAGAYVGARSPATLAAHDAINQAKEV
jgi:hypothetical protein